MTIVEIETRIETSGSVGELQRLALVALEESNGKAFAYARRAHRAAITALSRARQLGAARGSDVETMLAVLRARLHIEREQGRDRLTSTAGMIREIEATGMVPYNAGG